MKQKLLSLALISFLFFPTLVLAIIPNGNGGGSITPLPRSPVQSISGAVDVLSFILNILFTVLMIAAVFFLLLAGFYYLTAQGDASKAIKAHSMLLYAAVAIAVGLTAQGFRAIVRSILFRTP